MENSRIVFILNDTVRAVLAQYEEHGKQEMFKTLDPSVKVGDMAVVQSGTRFGMTTVKVTAVDVDVNFDSTTPIPWIVQIVDKPAFDEILKKEGEAIAAVQAAELRRKKAELRATMIKDHEASISALALSNHADAPVID